MEVSQVPSIWVPESTMRRPYPIPLIAVTTISPYPHPHHPQPSPTLRSPCSMPSECRCSMAQAMWCARPTATGRWVAPLVGSLNRPESRAARREPCGGVSALATWVGGTPSAVATLSSGNRGRSLRVYVLGLCCSVWQPTTACTPHPLTFGRSMLGVFYALQHGNPETPQHPKVLQPSTADPQPHQSTILHDQPARQGRGGVSRGRAARRVGLMKNGSKAGECSSTWLTREEVR